MAFLPMTKLIVKNLFTRPVTERYPFVPKKYYPGTRGKVLIEVEKCIFCGICQRRCPTAAIGVSKEKKSWDIERMRCISCNLCVEVCPKKCLALDVKYSAAAGGLQKEEFHA
ncbi:MAG: 4Fe-4S dicluster domain-containing protein [Candidatus Omnitrophica bacterium]|nr:4Fe-4S dicluster domain-containing protein [Candidatus Omnitrophota bacterium]